MRKHNRAKSLSAWDLLYIGIVGEKGGTGAQRKEQIQESVLA